jgi:hypothetical protein
MMLMGRIRAYLTFRGPIFATLVLAALMVVAAPAMAKKKHRHPMQKPSALWNQYPLNVAPSAKPLPTPSPRASVSASPRSDRTLSSHLTRDTAPSKRSTGGGVLLPVVGVAMLALLGIGIAVIRQSGASGAIPASSTDLPLIPQNTGYEANHDSSERISDDRRSEQEPTGEEAPSGVGNGQLSEPQREKVQEKTVIGGTGVTEVGRGTPDIRGTGSLEGVDRVHTQLVSDDGDETTEQHASDAPHLRQAEEARWGSNGASVRERVLVRLADGRSLEGWRRESTSPDENVLILDIIQAFDADGNETPTSRADSFILRSEVASVQTIEDT